MRGVASRRNLRTCPRADASSFERWPVITANRVEPITLAVTGVEGVVVDEARGEWLPREPISADSYRLGEGKKEAWR